MPFLGVNARPFGRLLFRRLGLVSVRALLGMTGARQLLHGVQAPKSTDANMRRVGHGVAEGTHPGNRT